MITSIHNETIKSLKKLYKKKYRDQENCFLVEGHHMVNEALASGMADLVITTDSNYQCDCDVLIVSETVIKHLSETKTPQNVLARCRKPDNKIVAGHRYLILDGVQDPGNVGTMIRSALAFGFDQVILSDDSVDLYNDKVLRSTQGALFHISVIRSQLKALIPELKQKGVKVIGTSLQSAVPIDDINTVDQMAFVMGSEGQGMHDDILSLCDQALYIPITTMESLNVGVAAGIIMHHFHANF